ncbi:hypothetical protein WN48_10789 [Eufriesea mexicana]|uniref:Uncharacterized protein n=1 Tax=Eufriesea mexicana TaxID=516756 RepID=A0A310SNA0_9HYME|nr:hypothetical protein WN48_10789 [Eufriesea mexicana]
MSRSVAIMSKPVILQGKSCPLAIPRDRQPAANETRLNNSRTTFVRSLYRDVSCLPRTFTHGENTTHRPTEEQYFQNNRSRTVLAGVGLEPGLRASELKQDRGGPAPQVPRLCHADRACRGTSDQRSNAARSHRIHPRRGTEIANERRIQEDSSDPSPSDSWKRVSGARRECDTEHVHAR